MKISLFLLAFLIVFGGVSLWIANKRNSITDLKNSYLHQPVPQALHQRNWRKTEFKFLGVYNALLNPLGSMTYDKKNNFYVADYGDMKIKKFNKHAEYIESFGKGRGEGPGEFSNIIGLHVDERNKLWVTDNFNSRVTIFKTPSSYDIINTSVVPYRLLPIIEGKYLVRNRYDNQDKIYNLSGKFISETEQIIDDPSLWAYVLDGFYSLTPENNIVKSFRHTNQLLKISEHGKILFYRESIKPPQELPIDPYYANDFARVNTVSDEKSETLASGIPQIVNKTIHIFIITRNDDEENSWTRDTVDVYDLHNGDYLYSYNLPEPFTTISISNNYLAGIKRSSSSFEIWKIENGWPE